MQELVTTIETLCLTVSNLKAQIEQLSHMNKIQAEKITSLEASKKTED